MKLGSLLAAGMLVAVCSLAHARPEAADTLDPAPPPWLTCKASGVETHCSASFDLIQTAVSSFFYCPTFEILENAQVHLDWRLTYNAQGKLTHWTSHVNQPVVGNHNIWFNATDPSKWVPMGGNWNTNLDFPTPGDFSTVIETDTGLLGRVVLPAGKSIVLDAGITILDPNLNVLFEAGQHFLYVSPNSEQMQQVCAALL